MVKIRIATENAAFSEGAVGDEIAGILRCLADKVEGSNMEDESIRLRDADGNGVGWLEVDEIENPQ